MNKIIFRFAFLLFILFILLFNNALLPYSTAFSALLPFKSFLLNGIAKSFFGLNGPFVDPSNGSGDTTYHYLLLFLVTTLSFLCAIIWTVLDRKRDHYDSLYYWLTAIVRLYVGITLIRYGLFKIIQTQFPCPSLYRLTSTYGDSSPMGLAWAFFGYSAGYNLFTGIIEFMGCLLFFRRTVSIGAILSLLTTVNVMAINYFYDVPVKILSTALVLMCIFLMLPNISILYRLFWNGEAVQLKSVEPTLHKTKWMPIVKVITKYLLITLSIIFTLRSIFSFHAGYGNKSPLFGYYEVSSYLVNGDTAASQNHEKWSVLQLEGEKHSAIKYDDGSVAYIQAEADTVNKKLKITSPSRLNGFTSYNYEVSDSLNLVLTGKINGSLVQINLIKKEFLLVQRGFHWINEQPFNR